MILTSEYLEKSFEIKEQRLNTIVLENKIYYRKIIQAVRDTINLDLKEFVLYEDEEEVKLNTRIISKFFYDGWEKLRGF